MGEIAPFVPLLCFSYRLTNARIIGVFGIPVGIFLFAFSNSIGATLVALAVTLLGIVITLLPFPADNMITKGKIKKAVAQTRVIGIALLILGIVCFIADFIFFL